MAKKETDKQTNTITQNTTYKANNWTTRTLSKTRVDLLDYQEG